jgi:hypothetical protein
MTRHLVSGTRRTGDSAPPALRSRPCRNRNTGEKSCALLMKGMFLATPDACQHSEFLN